MARPRLKRRFAIGVKVRIINPGITGVVTCSEDEPGSLGEYWHSVKTEYGESYEPGCNLELIPTPKTNTDPTGSTRIHIGHMENSAFIQNSPGASISQSFDISSAEFKSFVQNLRELVAATKLTTDQRALADSEFSSVETELASPTPRQGVVRVSLQSLRTILESAAGSLIGSAAYAALVYYILHMKP